MEPLALSHFSIVTCLGAGIEATLAALRKGRSGLKPCPSAFADIATYVGEVGGLESIVIPQALSQFKCRNNRLALMALEQDDFMTVLARARARYGAHRIAMVLGTSTSGIGETEAGYRRRGERAGALPPAFDYAGSHNAFSLARFLAAYLGLTGPALTISAACATTAKAFASAARLMAAGLCDAALVGGADSLCHTTLYGFRSLALTSEEPCRPYDEDRSGISIGEAAAFALLEKDAQAPPDAIRLLGAGESSDAYHMSTPHPDGEGAKLAMERALVAAGLGPGDIDYINLHGTATKVGDAAEHNAIAGLFGLDIPCSSTKGHTGHTLGAAGIVETVISALSLRYGLIPGSPMTRKIDPALRSGYVIEARTKSLRRAMTNSFGFGGSNCSLILGRA